MEGHSHDDLHGYDSQSQDFFCFQVATNAEGYNSGRTYTLRTRDKQLYDEILPLLIKLSKKARSRARAHSLFQKCQWKVSKFYSHNICQSIIATVIMGVRSPSFLSHFVRLTIELDVRRASRAQSPRRSTASPYPPTNPSPGSSTSSTSSSRSSSPWSWLSPPSPTGSSPSSATPGPGSTPSW